MSEERPPLQDSAGEPEGIYRLMQLLERHGDRLARMVRDRVVELLGQASAPPQDTAAAGAAASSPQSPDSAAKTRRRRKPAKPCSVDGCERPARARGLCSRHYQRQRYEEKRASGEAGQKVRGQGRCSVDGCSEVVYARSMCSRHFMEWVREKRKNK